MISCFQQKKKGESMKDKIIEYGTEILYKGLQKMKNDEKLLLSYIILSLLAMFIMSFMLYTYHRTIQNYKQADYALELKLEKAQEQLEIIKVLAQGEKTKSTKEEIAEALEEYFKTKRSK